MTRILFLTVNLILMSSLGFSAENSVNSLSSTEFLFESIGKLDDLIEQIEFKESTGHLDKISFTLSTLSYLTPISATMVNHSLRQSKYIIPVITENSLTTAATTSLSEFISNFSLTVNSVRIYSEALSLRERIENFSIHRADLSILKNILKTVRAHQISLLDTQLKEKSNRHHGLNQGLYDLEKLVMQKRPTYQAIHSECSKDVAAYKNKVKLDTLKYSLVDLYRLMSFSPAIVKFQLKAHFSSPSLNAYLSQEVLPSALSDCFAQESLSEQESFNDFTDRLHTIENLARTIVLTGAGSALLLGRNLISHPALKAMVEYFSKTSLLLAKRAVIVTTIVAGIYCSFQLKKTYDVANDKDTARFTPQQYTDYVKSSFQNQAKKKMEDLQNEINQNANNENLRLRLQNELAKWQIVSSELAK